MCLRLGLCLCPCLCVFFDVVPAHFCASGDVCVFGGVSLLARSYVSVPVRLCVCVRGSIVLFGMCVCILVSLGVYLFVGESWQLGQEIRDSGHRGQKKSLQHAKAPGKRCSLEGESHDDGQRKVNRG